MNAIRASDDRLEQLAQDAIADDAAFDRLVRVCYERIHRWALVAAGDPDDADDVVQETLLRLHRSLPGFRGDCSFTSWIYRITRTAALDLNRRRSSRVRRLLRLPGVNETEATAPPAIIRRLERERTADLVRSFLKDLPPRQRQVLDLADMQGYSPAEISEMLEMKPVTVRAHLFKARRTLRQRVLESEAWSGEEAAG